MGLPENLQNEHVQKLALREPITVSPTDTVQAAIDGMRGKNLGCVVAIDEDNKPVGLFTESMLTQLVAAEKTFLDEPISNHLAERFPWVSMSDPISYVLEAMNEKNVRFLCVLDDDGKLVGLTGQKGLIEFVADHFAEQVTVQRIGNTPYTQSREGA